MHKYRKNWSFISSENSPWTLTLDLRINGFNSLTIKWAKALKYSKLKRTHSQRINCWLLLSIYQILKWHRLWLKRRFQLKPSSIFWRPVNSCLFSKYKWLWLMWRSGNNCMKHFNMNGISAQIIRASMWLRSRYQGEWRCDIWIDSSIWQSSFSHLWISITSFSKKVS